MERVVPARALYAGDDERPIRIGVSSCLLGEEVRFDGGHKRNDFLTDTLGSFVEFVPVCPELEIGLGVPRESIRLVRDTTDAGLIRLVGNKTGFDHTDRMNAYAERRTAALGREELCGYVLKKDSPSCGMERVRVYDSTGMPARNGVGLYAAALLRRFPGLPVEEEGRLNDPHLRENFVERVFAYRRLRSFFSARWTLGGLVQFHTAHKLVLMAHSPKAYGELGRFVANAKQVPRQDPRRLRAGVHGRAQEAGDDGAPCQRAAAHARLPARSSRRDRAGRTRGANRRLSPGPGAAGGADYTFPPLRARVRRHLSARPGLP